MYPQKVPALKDNSSVFKGEELLVTLLLHDPSNDYAFIAVKVSLLQVNVSY